MRLLALVAALCLLLVFNLQAQTVINGIVTDNTNQTIPFAAVYLSKTTIGTTTNKEGAYILTIPQDGEYELVASFIGYKSYSRTLTVEGKNQTINIKLAENSILLDEITVKSKDRHRETNLALFNKLFLGQTVNALNCKILNPEDLYLYRESNSELLKGHSLKSLRIENRSLGYTIVYDLADFVYDAKNGLLKFTGSNFFIPLEGNLKLAKKWERSRLATYYGSKLHFLRSLYLDSLQHENFQIYSCDPKAYRKDSLKISPICADSLRLSRSDKFMTLFSARPILVNYFDTHAELYSGLFGFQRQNFKSTIEFSRSLKVFANGFFPNPYNVTWLGEMANERVADMLPYDFFPHGVTTVKAVPLEKVSSIEESLKYNQKKTSKEQLFVHLDRNEYRPGDTIFFQAYIRDRITGIFKSKSVSMYALLFDEKRMLSDSSRFRIENATASGWMLIPANATSGKYHFSAFTSSMQNNDPIEAFQQDLYVQEMTANFYQMQVIFNKKIYLPHDTLEATLRIADPNGNPARNLRFFSSLVSGKSVAGSKETETNAKGEALIRFVLPDSIISPPILKIVAKPTSGKGYSSENFIIPVEEYCMDLRFLPEGGNFIEGVEQRIGFNATNNIGESIQIEALLKNSAGTVLDTLRSGAYGPGIFTCRAQSGLYAETTKGDGSIKKWPLPEPAITGIALGTRPADGKSLVVEIQSNAYNGETVTVSGTMNLVQFFSQEVKLTEKQQIIVDTERLQAGIANITLFDKSLRPVAERLVYLNCDNHLKFDIRTNEHLVHPGSESELSVSVTDGEGKPSEGFFSISVTDSLRGIAANLFAPGIEYTYQYHPFFPGNLPGKVLASGVENLTNEERDLLLMVYGWTKINWNLKQLNSDTSRIINYDLLNLKVLYTGKYHKADRSLDLVSLEGLSVNHLFTNDIGEIVLPLDSLSATTKSVIIMPDVKSKNKATGAMLGVPYNEKFFRSDKLFVRQPLLPAVNCRIAPPDQPFVMEEHTIEIPEITVLGHQVEKVYKDEFEKKYQADNVKSLDYEMLWSSTTLETAIRKLVNPYRITIGNIYLRPTISFFSGPLPALIVLDGLPLLDQGWPRVSTISPSEVTSLTILDSRMGYVKYGEPAQGGVIFINTRSSNPDLVKQRIKWNVQNKNDKMMVPISLYRPQVEFYNPTKVELDNNPLLQSRATILWRNEVYFGGKNPVKIKVPNLKHTGPVVVSVNGVSVDNLFGSGRGSYVVQ